MMIRGIASRTFLPRINNILAPSSTAAAADLSQTILGSTRTFTTTKEEPTNYFQILNQTQSFQISLPSLKQSYQSHMKLLHPDKHALSSSEVQQETASRSTQITHGYQILKNDYQRALHLLELNGHGLEEEDGMSISGDIVGMDVLMLVMEVRELVDNEEDVKELEGMMKDNDERVEDTTRMLEEAFERDDMGEAKRLVATLQYWNRIHDTILEKL
jgi:molecular chaperone HscB